MINCRCKAIIMNPSPSSFLVLFIILMCSSDYFTSHTQIHSFSVPHTHRQTASVYTCILHRYTTPLNTFDLLILIFHSGKKIKRGKKEILRIYKEIFSKD